MTRKISEQADTRDGYLKKDRMERYNLSRGWFVNAWRIVDKEGNDIIQPWSTTKKEALETASKCGISIVGMLD